MSNTKKFDKVLVDGDLLIYAVAFATQRNIWHIYVDELLAYVGTDKREINEKFSEIEYTYEKYTYTQPPFAAIKTYDTILKGYAKRFKTNKIDVHLTGDTNFRNEIAISRPYKGTREAPKPNNYAVLKEYAIKNGAIVSENEEADDVLSYLSCNNYDVVVVTIDKDAINTPSYIYNNKQDKLIYVSEEDANKNFWSQVITGDTVDNIPGLPNVGKVWVEENLCGLSSYQELEQAVGLAYACHPDIDDPEAYLTEQATLLWMRRKPGERWRIGRE